MMKSNNFIKQTTILALLLFILSSCATSTGANSTTAKKKVYDPTGSWEYYVNTPDGGSGGTMTISGAPGAYTGTLSTDQFGTLELMGLDILDQNMTASIEVMGMGADIEASFDGDTFAGIVYLGDDAFQMEGKRVSK